MQVPRGEVLFPGPGVAFHLRGDAEVLLRVQEEKSGLYLGANMHVGRVEVLATRTVPFEAVEETRALN